MNELHWRFVDMAAPRCARNALADSTTSHLASPRETVPTQFATASTGDAVAGETLYMGESLASRVLLHTRGVRLSKCVCFLCILTAACGRP